MKRSPDVSSIEGAFDAEATSLHDIAGCWCGPVAIGPNAVDKNAGDVAIGLNSSSGTTAAVGSTTIGGKNNSFAGAKPVGAFSVGAASSARQIQNVAAGQLSDAPMDAVNG